MREKEKEKGNWSEWDRHFHFIHLFFFINQFPNFVFSMYKITNIPKSNITGFLHRQNVLLKPT